MHVNERGKCWSDGRDSGGTASGEEGALGGWKGAVRAWSHPSERRYDVDVGMDIDER